MFEWHQECTGEQFDSFGEQTFQQNSQQTFEQSFTSTKSQQNSLRAIQLTHIENFVEIRLFIICLNYSSGHSSSQNSVEIFVEKSVGNFVEILVLSWWGSLCMCFQQIAPNFNLNRLFNKVFDISIELHQAKNVVEKSVQYYVETQQSYRIALLWRKWGRK